jgi:hypothetical protein
MYGDLSYSQHLATQSGYGQSGNTSVARRLAASQFWTMRLTATWGQIFSRLSGRPQHPADLNEVVQGRRIHYRRSLGLRTVPVSEIVGSEGRSDDFDTEFRPLVGHIRDRWIGIAVARMRGVVLPPVSLVKFDGRYYVRDGNHRVSVARFLGQAEIEAEVTAWQTE